MAGASLLTLLDDIAAVLDDVSLMTKVAAKKTAGVLGDDLALNAQQVTGVNADRELPVVWAVAKGSLRNKAILVPAALLISAFAPWAVILLLMLGGAYLCFSRASRRSPTNTCPMTTSTPTRQRWRPMSTWLPWKSRRSAARSVPTSSSPRKSSPSPSVPSPNPASPPRCWCWSASPW